MTSTDTTAKPDLRCNLFTNCNSAPVTHTILWQHGTTDDAARCWLGPDQDHVHLAHTCAQHLVATYQDLASVGLVAVATVAADGDR